MGFPADVSSANPLKGVDGSKSLQSDMIDIGGMTCSSCTALIENVIGEEEGVESIEVNLPMERAKVVYDCNKTGIRNLLNQINDLGFTAKIHSDDQPGKKKKSKDKLKKHQRDLIISIILTSPIFLTMFFLSHIPQVKEFMQAKVVVALTRQNLIYFLLATPVQVRSDKIKNNE